jgi:hypothetical protein
MSERNSTSLIALFLLTLMITLTSITVSSQAHAETFRWQTPTQRMNGQLLPADQIGGYEIIGHNAQGATVWRVNIPGKHTQVFSSNDPAIKTAVTFVIAVYDTDGLYSEFVSIKHIKLAPPTGGGLKAPTGGGIR